MIVAALVPLTVVALVKVGGWDGWRSRSRSPSSARRRSTPGRAPRPATPTGAFGNWIAIVFGLGFVLSFGYWTTNFAEVQRALSARDMNPRG